MSFAEKPRSVLVLGGGGFVGRHAVAALVDAGVRVVVGSRTPDRLASRLPDEALSAERRAVRFETTVTADQWAPLIDDVDAILNCVGILRQRGRSTYDVVHHRAPGALAEAAARGGKRFVHVSALGLEKPARSRFLTSKLAGERAIRRHRGDWILARPSLLDGVGGFGASWLRGIARVPRFVAPADARGKIAALDVGELGEALTRLCLEDDAALELDTSREFELGGEEHYEFRDYIAALRQSYSDRPALCIPIPGMLARLGAHMCDLTHFSPFSFGHWELLRRDNVPNVNRLPELLRRPPLSVVSRAL
ncbi:MAG: NAD(P)H-binding protein [Pseudomonadota bacterium]